MSTESIAQSLANIGNAAVRATMYAPLRKVRGEVRKGNYSERPGILATFLASPDAIDSVTYFTSKDKPGHLCISVCRSLFTHWRGYVTFAQFEAVRDIVTSAKCYLAFPSEVAQ